MATNDDDVPPLEDCSDLIEKASSLRESGYRVRSEPSSSSTAKPINSTSSTSSVKSATETPKTNGAGAKSHFGGFKKGFLFGGSSQKKTTKPEEVKKEKKDGDDLEMIVPKQTKEDSLRIDEVQDSLKEELGFKKGWITEELITKMVENPKMASWLADPRTSHILEEFQRNPAAAQEKYQENADILQFFRDFAHLMSDHMKDLAKAEEAKKEEEEAKKRAEETPAIRTLEEARADEALEDPEVRTALMDPDVQRAIEAIREDPSNGERIMNTADQRLRYHLTTLVRAGVLGLQ